MTPAQALNRKGLWLNDVFIAEVPDYAVESLTKAVQLGQSQHPSETAYLETAEISPPSFADNQRPIETLDLHIRFTHSSGLRKE